MLADGSNGSVEFLGDRIIIRRKGFANKLTQGFQGDKTIMLRHLTSVQFRPAGSMLAGSIQFTVMGGREYGGGLLEATKDENAVLFAKDQQMAFSEMRDSVQHSIANGGQAPASPAQSIAAELSALADLLDRGHLSREEFETEKQKLLFNRPSEYSHDPKTRESAEEGPVATKAKFHGKGCMWAAALVVGLFILSAAFG